MHLLNARQATTDDDGEAVDLGQSPGDIVYISAADTELRSLAAAQAKDGQADAPSLRLANMLRLAHPMSVDLYVEDGRRQGKLVVLRLLGGRSYWPYGLEQIAAAAGRRTFRSRCCRAMISPIRSWRDGARFQPRPATGFGSMACMEASTIARRCCAMPRNLLGREEVWTEPAPLLRAGIYWPGVVKRIRILGKLRHGLWDRERPVVAVVFYRALVQAADLDVVDALISALDHAGINALPLYVTSLKDKSVASLIAELLDDADASVSS